ncbi:putative peptidoglycan lipid II flippase [Allopseudospirillum japonicum]|uniref:Probable lipid II flippase MurJ n=1 Tax=Allopseudospirillum japonicum TaxID=64971 RepID=A0A1H6THW8_9GAMM|nr:murein biosynthesis integral membrane protein MurJ [Allopseudospirillum japonicum]SEI79659.1 putative peptidoglycan lipid II flippase [Allopseudospirillum japonicum]
MSAPCSQTPPASSSQAAKRGLLGSSLLVSLMTLVSRVLGLARDISIALLFGAGSGADAFFVAFKIPNFLRRLFAEGAFNQAFVPVLSEYRSQHPSEVRPLIGAVFIALSSVLFVVTGLAIWGAPWLVWVFAPGFAQDADQLALTAQMLQMTFPYLALISLTAFCSSILNTYDKFAIPAFTPVWLNLSLIACAFLLTPWLETPIFALAWGVLIAGVIQLIFQLPFLAQLALLPPLPSSWQAWKQAWQHSGVKRILDLMLPALFGVSVSQINLLLDTILASLLVTGSVSWLYYSDRLVELPLGVFGIAIATVILPSLSRQHTQADQTAFGRLLVWGLRLVLLIALPAALGLMLLAEPLLTTLFQYGAMGTQDVTMAALSLRAYALGLVAFMLIKVLAPGFYARQDTRTPVRIGVKAMLANMVFNLLLVWHLAHTGLALATALSAFLNAYWLYQGLRQAGILTDLNELWPYVLKLSAGLLALAIAVVISSQPLDWWFAATWWMRTLTLAMQIGLGAAAYFGVLWLLGIRWQALKTHEPPAS